MSKTIEELAKQYADDMCPIGDCCGGVYDEQRHSDLSIYTDDAKSVLSWLFGKPLASRLTAEEKERVKAKYWAAAKDNAGLGKAWNQCRMCVILESIFGKDFFKEI